MSSRRPSGTSSDEGNQVGTSDFRPSGTRACDGHNVSSWRHLSLKKMLSSLKIYMYPLGGTPLL